METSTAVQLPKVAIRFCVQCKWNLRAAYFAQELLQTFSNTLGEVALIPVTGGVFTIILYHKNESTPETEVSETLIWDRKQDGGFPETKELKNRVRNIIDPARDMGHVDRALNRDKQKSSADGNLTATIGTSHNHHTISEQLANDCEECKEAAKDAQQST